ncbi:MAG TPA: MFS transporter [Gaiellaceae bacterium]|nr:MFS transporter [Gaiellaceae bacterium]
MRRLLLLVCSITLVDTMLYAALVPLLPHYASEFGLSKGEAGLLVGAYALGAFLGAIPGGIAATRFGPRRAVIAGLLLMAVASAGFGFAGSAATLGIARLAQGVGSALSWAGALAWLVAGTPRERRGEMLGTAIGAAIFGALLGPAVGAFAEGVGPRPAFVAVGAAGVALAVWALRTPPVATEPQSPRALLPALRQPLLLGALWLMVLPALLFGVVAVLVPLELGDAGWSAVAIAALFIGAAAVEMVVAPLLGRVSDRRGRLLPLRFALVAAIALTLGLAVAGSPLVIAPLVVGAAIAFGSFWAPAMALLSDAAERIGLAQALGFGLMNAAWGGGNSVGPALGGGLADLGGDAFPYALMGALCAVTLVMLTRGRQAFGTHLARVPENP